MMETALLKRREIYAIFHSGNPQKIANFCQEIPSFVEAEDSLPLPKKSSTGPF